MLSYRSFKFFSLHSGSVVKSMLESEMQKEITEIYPRKMESLVSVGRVPARERDVLYDINNRENVRSNPRWAEDTPLGSRCRV